MKRSELITQLRHALYLATKPSEDPVEFEVAETGFCFEYFDEEGKK